MQITRGKQWRLIVVWLMLAVACGLPVSAAWGQGLAVRGGEVEVSLAGMTGFGAVQLFDRLLRQADVTADVRQVRLTVMPGEPERCWAGWRLRLDGGDIETLQQQVMAAVAALEPEKRGDHLSNRAIVVMKEDLEMLKKIIPYTAGVGSVGFGPADLVRDVRVSRAFGRSGRPGRPHSGWLPDTGLGFE